LVQIFLEEIHLVQTGHSLVVAVAVDLQTIMVLTVVLMFQVVQEEYQVDHTTVQEVVH
jgi:hypothetical protein